MRYVMFTWVDPADAASWEGWSVEEKQADAEEHRAWFARHGARVAGGEELNWPRTVKALRPGRQGEGVMVTDGPHVETKEILGGFVILEAADLEEAVAMASEWPSLRSQPRAVVEVQGVLQR